MSTVFKVWSRLDGVDKIELRLDEKQISVRLHRWFHEISKTSPTIPSTSSSLRRRLVGYVPRADALALTSPQVEDADFAVAAGRDAHLRVVVEHAGRHLRVGRRGRRLGRQVVFLARVQFSITISSV